MSVIFVCNCGICSLFIFNLFTLLFWQLSGIACLSSILANMSVGEIVRSEAAGVIAQVTSPCLEQYQHLPGFIEHLEDLVDSLTCEHTFNHLIHCNTLICFYSFLSISCFNSSLISSMDHNYVETSSFNYF